MGRTKKEEKGGDPQFTFLATLLVSSQVTTSSAAKCAMTFTHMVAAVINAISLQQPLHLVSLAIDCSLRRNVCLGVSRRHEKQNVLRRKAKRSRRQKGESVSANTN